MVKLKGSLWSDLTLKQVYGSAIRELLNDNTTTLKLRGLI